MINGIININKPAGFTSFDVVAKLRGIAGQRKIGHTGTLDPDATGVLPVVLGSATKLVEMLQEKKKEYVVTYELGKTTDTLDASGKVTGSFDVNVTEEQVREVIASFTGDIMQIPPMFSALKVDGKRLYELAREGKEVERKARPVTIYDIEILEINLPVIRMRVECSKGTYIRTLCADIGEKLGCGAVMTNLIRTASGQFTLDMSYTFEELQELKEAGRLNEAVTPVDFLFGDYRAVYPEGEMLKAFLNGNSVKKASIISFMTKDGREDKLRVYNADGSLIATYYYDDERKAYKVERMFLSE